MTTLLRAWRSGDETALDRMIPLVYGELRSIAARLMQGERPDHTLQATALVHEAYERLVGAEVDWRDRSHFFAVAARQMRRILVDYARARRQEKRGGGKRPFSLDEGLAVSADANEGVIELDEALTRLTAIDERKGRVVELHYFGGLTYDEAAEALGISAATVDRDLRFAKAWLQREIEAAP